VQARHDLSFLFGIVLGGCAAASEGPPLEYPALPAQEPAPAAAVAAAPAASTASAASTAPAARELSGEWVEFWALSGDADTQRYVFTKDGHYEWHATAQSQDPVQARFGTYAVAGDALELQVRFEQQRGKCTNGCRTPVEPPRAESVVLADCPPNEEAKKLDASYRCLAIGDRAFWFKSAR
jgi:hypothetical protein